MPSKMIYPDHKIAELLAEVKQLKTENAKLRADNERMHGVLLHISVMECYSPEGSKPAHIVMMEIAANALDQEHTK